MNRTTEQLQSQYTRRFLLTSVCALLTGLTAHFILMGKVGFDNLLPAAGIALGCGCVAWLGTGSLCRLRKQLQQLDLMQQHGPYDRREYVPPREASRQLGDDDGPNMWGRP
jgi:hypothetical protein